MPSFLLPFPIVEPATGFLSCEGEEEFFETSGSNDNVGTASIDLAPEQWQHETIITVSPPFDAAHDCGRFLEIGAKHGDAFEATVQVFPRPLH